MNNKDADDTARMRWLVCAFVVHKPMKTGFLASMPICVMPLLLLAGEAYYSGVNGLKFSLSFHPVLTLFVIEVNALARLREEKVQTS